MKDTTTTIDEILADMQAELIASEGISIDRDSLSVATKALKTLIHQQVAEAYKQGYIDAGIAQLTKEVTTTTTEAQS